ncbi:MAG: histidine--tRNA ligase [Proteobacteria bacterium]|nr:histidine--tRNA ligase [Pseudomonadota bacterium]
MVQSVRGMRDVLPDEARRWRSVEDRIKYLMLGYGYEEIHLPLLEATELFSRGVGEGTDIVEKEMYTLTDQEGSGITLRPEGTASCVRALQEHGLLFNQTQRVFYSGPMFRYERPQKGRYRQFYQIGAEVFGAGGAEVDAELISMCYRLWCDLGIDRRVHLELNTLGSSSVRKRYREALVTYLTPLIDQLDEDSQRRLSRNPLRILDSKNPQTQALLEDAPVMSAFLDEESVANYERLKELLNQLQVPYQQNDRLVRGLDYYTDTVFEWVTTDLGSQGTICAGGRYDGLVEMLGGKPTPGSGYAIGLERVLLLHELDHAEREPRSADVYCCVVDPAQHGWAMHFIEQLRELAPDLRIRLHAGGGKLKNQLKRADQTGAQWALIAGDSEVTNNRVAVKFLRTDQAQVEMGLNELAAFLNNAIQS